MKRLKTSFWIVFVIGLGGLTPAWSKEGILDFNRFMSEIEPLLITKTYASPGPSPMSCLACHGVSANIAYTAFPLAAGRPRNNFTEVARRVKLDDPESSLLLLKPLSLVGGGVSHGLVFKDGGEQFANAVNDLNYLVIKNWILDATAANSGARISRTEAYPTPFRTSTNIVYFLTTDALEVNIGVFGLNGNQVRSFTGTTRVGANNVTWDGRDEDNEPLGTGIYFYSVKAKFRDDASQMNGRCVYTP